MKSSWRSIWVSLILLAFMANTTWAVIVATTTDNTTPPPDDPGFNNIGLTGGPNFNSSSVYLGNRYVLTARHNFTNPVMFDGTEYPVEPGTTRRLRNPTGLGLTEFTDLILYQTASQPVPMLPSITIASSPPDVGEEVVMIGHGKNRSATQRAWDVSMGGSENDPWTWTDNPTGPGDVRGFDIISSNTTRWGTNLIERDSDFFSEEDDPDHNVVIESVGGNGDVVTLFTQFDEGITDEAVAALHDSGGGVFYKDGNDWKLAGVMLYFLPAQDQPGNGSAGAGGTVTMANASYVGAGTKTFFADLSVYRDQIEAIVPEPSTGLSALLGLAVLLLGSGSRWRVRSVV